MRAGDSSKARGTCYMLHASRTHTWNVHHGRVRHSSSTHHHSWHSAHALSLQAAGFDLTALDAAPEGLDEIDKTGTDVTCQLGRMDDLPFEDNAFDHVLSWNVIYHGDETVLLNTIREVRRVLKLGGTFMLTMLSKRRLSIDRERLKGPRELSRNTWVFDDERSDKRHPHYYCSAAEMLALFQGFEVKWMEDREHDKPGSWHWHLILERTA